MRKPDIFKDELTNASVAVVTEVVSLSAVTLEHVVVDVETNLSTRVPIFALT
jgi:hypothetical protein